MKIPMDVSIHPSYLKRISVPGFSFLVKEKVLHFLLKRQNEKLYVFTQSCAHRKVNELKKVTPPFLDNLSFPLTSDT